jgi:hypothetical protein
MRISRPAFKELLPRACDGRPSGLPAAASLTGGTCTVYVFAFFQLVRFQQWSGAY